MMQSGLLAETQRLVSQYGLDAPGLSGLGYRQLVKHLRGELSLAAAVDRIKVETRQYAKRQLTWYKRNKGIHWLARPAEATDLVSRFLGSR
jgi:tRNA dimethylallyltransferase